MKYIILYGDSYTRTYYTGSVTAPENVLHISWGGNFFDATEFDSIEVAEKLLRNIQFQGYRLSSATKIEKSFSSKLDALIVL